MCLAITPLSKTKLSKPVRVYKFYQRVGKSKLTVEAPYQGTRYRLVQGQFIRSNRQRTALTSYELSWDEVNQGFHVYTNKRAAIANARQSGAELVATFEGYPEDFVASGEFGGDNSMVFTKLKFLELTELPERP